MNSIEIDNITPSGAALLCDTRDHVLLQHGGVATCLSYDSVEEMTISEFVKDEVPKMVSLSDSKESDKGSAARRSLYILRDACAGAYTFILGDKVIKYNLTDVSEVPLKTMIEYLCRDKTEEFVPNVQYPLIALSKNSTFRAITVRLESMHRRYRSPLISVDTYIWTPPVWFTVVLNNADNLTETRICVAPNIEEDNRRATLFRWPLANVYASGQVCMGEASMEIASDATSDSSLLQSAIDLFFNAEFNLDLVSASELEQVAGTAYTSASKRAEYANRIANTTNSSTKGILKVLCVLEDKEGWRRLKLAKWGGQPSDFWRCRG